MIMLCTLLLQSQAPSIDIVRLPPLSYSVTLFRRSVSAPGGKRLGHGRQHREKPQSLLQSFESSQLLILSVEKVLKSPYAILGLVLHIIAESAQSRLYPGRIASGDRHHRIAEVHSRLGVGTFQLCYKKFFACRPSCSS